MVSFLLGLRLTYFVRWGLHGTQHGDIIGHSRYLASGSLDYNLTQIFHTPYDIPIRSARQASELVSVTLPPSREYNALHIFALTAVPSRRMNDANYRPPVSERMVVRSVRGTKRHSADFSGWIVEVLVANPWSLSHVGQAEYWLDTPARIQLDPTDGLQTINPALIHRLMPGEEVLVEVVVKGSTSSRTATVLIDTPIGWWRQEASLEGVLDGYQTYEPTMESTQQHSAPSWYRDAKFGVRQHQMQPLTIFLDLHSLGTLCRSRMERTSTVCRMVLVLATDRGQGGS